MQGMGVRLVGVADFVFLPITQIEYYTICVKCSHIMRSWYYSWQENKATTSNSCTIFISSRTSLLPDMMLLIFHWQMIFHCQIWKLQQLHMISLVCKAFSKLFKHVRYSVYCYILIIAIYKPRADIISLVWWTREWT